jgi:predicted MFS family arabinose efflux permease
LGQALGAFIGSWLVVIAGIRSLPYAGASVAALAIVLLFPSGQILLSDSDDCLREADTA